MHDFGHGFIGQIRANYQIIPGKDIVPYADQMTAGGMNSVRGYSEGLLIGKNGYIIGTELQFPILPRAIKSRDKSKYIPFVGNYLKGFVFWDFAGIFPYKGSGNGAQTAHKEDYLTSLGCGLKINLPKDLSLRLAWGFPLFYNNHEERHRWGRFHFDLNISPDFDTLLKMRKPKGEPVEMVQAPVPEQNQDKVQFANDVTPVKEAQQEKNIVNVSDKNDAAPAEEAQQNNNTINASDTNSAVQTEEVKEQKNVVNLTNTKNKLNSRNSNRDGQIFGTENEIRLDILNIQEN